MRIAEIDFPERLLAVLRDGNPVVFAGAGVSMGAPASLPSFKRLAEMIASGTGETLEKGEPEDRFLGKLSHRGVNVHTRAAAALHRDGMEPTSLHRSLLQLFREAEQVRIVTTNFDVLFEQAAGDEFSPTPEISCSPSLPLGRKFNGIVHVHGSINRPDEMVLTDSDFGRAYLTEGWARRFLLELFQNFTVLFVGYSHNDTIMNYLARALPAGEEHRRFALTEDKGSEAQRWRLLGIEPISYPKYSEGDHSSLYRGVQDLAQYVRRRVLDWQRQITDISKGSPPLGQEEADVIEEALGEATKTRFFANAASLPEWVGWLDERKLLDPLFGTAALSEKDDILAHWLTKNYLFNHPDDLFLLISRHSMRLHPTLWQDLAQEIGLGDSDSVDENLLSRWVSLLIATAPENVDEHVLLWMGETCASREMLDSLLQVFDKLAESRLQIKQGFSLNPSDEISTDVDLPLVGSHYALNNLWDKGFKPNLDQTAEPLLGRVMRRLEDQHLTLRSWQKANRRWDRVTWRRSAIEPHRQDRHPGPVDMLVDVARDCLEWLMGKQTVMATQWCVRLAGSDSPLSRRLAVHTISASPHLTADQKIDWLLANLDLLDSAIHHEVFQTLRLAYPEASRERRESLINEGLTYRWSSDSESDSEKERLTARVQFEWFHWLHSAAPGCALAKEALTDLWGQYPDFLPRDFPDLSYWVSPFQRAGHLSPWTIEELLSKPAGEWLEEILSFQGERGPGPDREGLLLHIVAAAKQNSVWGIELGAALAEAETWDVDLWSVLMRAWSDTELEEHQHRMVLQWSGNAGLYRQNSHAASIGLHSLVKRGGKPYAPNLLSEANEVAATLWGNLDPGDVNEEYDDWLRVTVNHPAETLTVYWLTGLSLWLRQQDPVPRTLNDEYEQVLSRIVQDQNMPGKIGRTILASEFSFLLEVDENWTKENLLPLFEVGNSDFWSAWDGLLAWGSLSPPVAECLNEVSLKAIPLMGAEGNDRRDRFVKFCTALIADSVQDPQDVWIPALFKGGGEGVGQPFAWEVEDHLYSLDGDEALQRDCWDRWLRTYWENRLEGVPAVLDDAREVEIMVGWLLHLEAVFPNAVATATRMPPVALEHSRIVYELDKTDLWTKHPDAVAQLLVYLSKCNAPRHIWSGGPELVDKLLQSSLPEELKTELRELVATLGLE